MQALRRVSEWPVDHVTAAVVRPGHELDVFGDPDRPYRLASISKPLTAWATLVAVEEGIVTLDDRRAASKSRTAARCGTCCRMPAGTRSTAPSRSRPPDAAGSTRTPVSSSSRPRSRRRRGMPFGAVPARSRVRAAGNAGIGASRVTGPRRVGHDGRPDPLRRRVAAAGAPRAVHGGRRDSSAVRRI